MKYQINKHVLLAKSIQTVGMLLCFMILLICLIDLSQVVTKLQYLVPIDNEMKLELKNWYLVLTLSLFIFPLIVKKINKIGSMGFSLLIAYLIVVSNILENLDSLIAFPEQTQQLNIIQKLNLLVIQPYLSLSLIIIMLLGLILITYRKSFKRGLWYVMFLVSVLLITNLSAFVIEKNILSSSLISITNNAKDFLSQSGEKEFCQINGIYCFHKGNDRTYSYIQNNKEDYQTRSMLEKIVNKYNSAKLEINSGVIQENKENVAVVKDKSKNLLIFVTKVFSYDMTYMMYEIAIILNLLGIIGLVISINLKNGIKK